jgi:16S rRNA (cytidine1402-2'-O)-methyltransferase
MARNGCRQQDQEWDVNAVKFICCIFGRIMAKGNLYLIPSFLGETAPEKEFPVCNLETIVGINDFIVEEIRTARRFLKKISKTFDISAINFCILNEHTGAQEMSSYLDAALNGKDMGLLSEAGMPCVADPGAVIVRMAHEKGIRVIPLPGPSSVFLALAASGFNGQNFCFHGYLPVEKSARALKIKELEQTAYARNQTQIFIETPYRNNAMFDALLHNCRPGTLLCIAADITLETEFIRTNTISQWKNQGAELNKKPAVFLLYH